MMMNETLVEIELLEKALREEKTGMSEQEN